MYLGDMAENKGWLEGFESEVGSPLGAGRASGRASEAQAKASAEFDLWWSSFGETGEGLSSASDELRQELAALREETRALKAELDASRAAAAAKAPEDPAAAARILQEELSKMRAELAQRDAALREGEDARSRLQAAAAETRVKMSRAQEGYEGHISSLKERAGGLEAQLRALEDAKRSVVEQAALMSSRCETLEAELRGARDAASKLERENAELSMELRQVRESLGRRESELARAEGAADEMRQRLAPAIAASPAPMPSAPVSSAGLDELQRRNEEKIRSAMLYLEDKIRQVQEDGQERIDEFRELLEALARLRRRQGEEP